MQVNGGVSISAIGRTRSACGEERGGFAGGHAVARGTCGRPAQLDDPPPSRRDRSARGGAHQPFAVVQVSGRRCHGVGGLVAEEHDENQLLRISVPCGDHSPTAFSETDRSTMLAVIRSVSKHRLARCGQTPFDGFFGTKFDILKPRWLPTDGARSRHRGCQGEYTAELSARLSETACRPKAQGTAWRK